MPVKSAKQYGFFQAIAHGGARKAGGPSPAQASEAIHKTPAAKRSGFARAIGNIKAKHRRGGY